MIQRQKTSRGILAALLMGVLAAGCATTRPRPGDKLTEAKMDAYSKQTRQAFEIGRDEALVDDGFVLALEENTLASTLFHFYAPFAGARRHLDFFEKNPDHILRDVYLTKNERGLYFDFQHDELFQSGNFFRNYEPVLFRPVFRQVLLQYALRSEWPEEDFRRLMLAMKEAARLTPRQAQTYPNDLRPPTVAALQAYVDKYPEDEISRRFRFLMLWSDRNGAWEGKRRRIDEEMQALLKATEDDLLKMEIEDALNAPRADPQSAFAMSLLVPGLGQVGNGDVQGGIILGGLTVAAWVWLVSKLVLASQTNDETVRNAAYGDAGYAGGLVAFGHLFTAYNAHEQARYMNVVIEWDLLNKPRLR